MLSRRENQEFNHIGHRGHGGRDTACALSKDWRGLLFRRGRHLVSFGLLGDDQILDLVVGGLRDDLLK